MHELIPVDPGGQLRLLPDDVTDEMLSKAEASQGICTGDRLKNYDAPRYELVCSLLADGSLSQRQISRITGISRNLVAGIVKSQTSDIEPLKARIAGQSRNLAQLCIERATEMVLDDRAKIGLRDLMIAAGVAADKSLVLAGQASSIVEFRPVDPGDDEFDRAMRSARRVDCVDVGESPVEMGFEAESLPAKGASDPVEMADSDPMPGAPAGEQNGGDK